MDHSTAPDDLWDFSDVWALAINGSGMGIWDRDMVAGVIRYSRSWFAMLGYDAIAWTDVAQSYARVHPDDLDRVKAKVQEHLDGQSAVYEVEYRLRCKDGSYKWVLSRGRAIARDTSGAPLRMVGTTVDITAMRSLAESLKAQYAEAEQKAAQLVALTDQLIERSQELAVAHRLAEVGSWRWDVIGRHLWFARETWLMMGLTPVEAPVTKAQVRALIHPDDYDRAMSTFYDVVRSGSAATLEYRFIRGDGTVRWALNHAEPVAGPDGAIMLVRGTTQDITAFRAIEQALRESEDHYRHMVDLHPQIPWTAGPEGGILEVGPQWFKLTGMTVAETIPFNWIDAVHPDDRPGIIAVWQASLASGERVDAEYRVKAADGGYVWLRARAAARLDEAGRIIRWYGTLEDINDRHVAEAARRASNALAFRVLETTSDAVIVCNLHGIITFANSKAAAQLGETASLVGRPAREILAGGHARRIGNAIGRAIEIGANTSFESFWAPTDRWFEIHVYASTDDVSVFLRDVTERRLAQQKLDFAATHDLLTRTLNREAFFADLAEALANQRPGNLVALFCLDLEYFKDFNDTHGHPAGDELLKQVANRLAGCMRSQDRLARSGGDEFLIMQTGVRSPSDATVLADRIIADMRQPFLVNGRSLTSAISIGIAVALLDGTEADDLYNKADLALYEAKAKARGGYRLFRPALQIESDDTRHMRHDLATALASGAFSLVYQPIVRIADRKVLGVEALLRWRHPERGNIPPLRFIPIAEASGLIAEIGAWVLQTACAAAMTWPEAINVAVNVSPRQFELGDVPSVVGEALRRSGLPAHRLKLEMTESILLSANNDNIVTLQQLRDLGVVLVLDDFGTGYSSISYLETFTFDFLKIDRSFLSNIHSAGDRQPIFEATIALANALDLPVTAEGVETETQLAYAARLGCAYAQGYLFSRPLSEDDLLAYLASTSCRATV